MSYSVGMGSVLVGAAAMVSEVIEGNFLRAALVPGVGYGLHKLGDHYKLRTVAVIGEGLGSGALFAIPAFIVGYPTYIWAGQTLASKVAIVVTGAATTGLMFSHVVETIAKGAAEAIVGCR